MNLMKYEVYKGDYRDVPFEITSQGNDGNIWWTISITVFEEQFPLSLQEKLCPDIYFNSYGNAVRETRKSYLKNLTWFHNGLSGLIPEYHSIFNAIKAFSSNNHASFLSVSDVYEDVKRCIDSLYNLVPDLKTKSSLYKEHHQKFSNTYEQANKKYDINGKLLAE